ncbi:MAG: diguanylate cyclase [Burkholderiales bacterium]|nr:diguanylate cyclase [Burkholderiales bacterium]
MLLPDTGREDALLAAERIRQCNTSETGLPVCTVSVGVACLGDPQTDSLTALIGRADAGLYRAKQMGRNRVEEAVSPGA